ncbi:phosphomevalonate kinase [Nocardia asteroides]|uniref:phosphomevalonate kinase n=1 Tax=Nocardia asteroides TaxID=1824 RepID=UPI0037B5CC66
MISCRAPGKLFIAGEYAVVEPGHRAVLTAVDRYATATVTELPGADMAAVLRSDLNGGVALSCHRDGHRLTPVTPDSVVPAAFSYVFAAASVLDRLRAERGIAARPYELAVSADLGDPDGRKYGLGSSAAVTVATVAALGRFHRLELTAMDRYRLAMLATIAVNPRASGGDVAAATWGGWLAYASPDRAAAAALAANDGIDAALRAPWPGLSVRPLRTPTRLALHVGWTGNPASTPDLVAAATADHAADKTSPGRGAAAGTDPAAATADDVRVAAAGTGLAAATAGDMRVAAAETGLAAATARDRRAAFNARSNECVDRLLTALDADDPVAVRTEIDCVRSLLVDLDDTTGLGIMTPRLRDLCAAGTAVGAAAKPSGAGGGDCGIALIERDRPAAIAELTGRWVAAGIRPLPLRIHPTEGEIA